MITCVCTYFCPETVSLFHCMGGKDDATTMLHSLCHLPHLPMHKRERKKVEMKYIHKHTKSNFVLQITNENSHTHLSPGDRIESGGGFIENKDVRIAGACHSK